jgi:hypothetical protein
MHDVNAIAHKLNVWQLSPWKAGWCRGIRLIYETRMALAAMVLQLVHPGKLLVTSVGATRMRLPDLVRVHVPSMSIASRKLAITAKLCA